MPLSATAVKNAKPDPGKAFVRIADEKGLALEVRASGGKWWRLRYRHLGKAKMISLGTYPDVSLAQARERRDEARKLIAEGIDPSEHRKQTASAQRELHANSFETIAREWYAKNLPQWSEGHARGVISRLERDAFPPLGGTPIAELEPRAILAVLERIHKRGALETAHRIKGYCGQIFRFAVATGRAERDPTQDLRGALPSPKVKHHASLQNPTDIGQLMRAIDAFEGTFVVQCALRLSPLVFLRPGELRGAQWAEIDLDGAEWRIPAERMKMAAPHIVPLSTQAVAILSELQPYTAQGFGDYVFPSVRTKAKPMSNNTINATLRRIGYGKEQMTAHGFRSMASTLLNEQGWNRDAIERQLAHAERDGVRAAYNYAEYLPERRQMMQAWADYLDGLKRGADVVPIQRSA